MDHRQRHAGRRLGHQIGDGLGEDGAALGVFVAQVDVDGVNAHHLRGDQRALQKAVRVALQVVPVLEGAGLAFVDIDGKEPWSVESAHDAPLAPGREARAAQAAQAGVLQRADHALCIALAQRQGARQRVAAGRQVGLVRYDFRSCLRPLGAGQRLV